MTNSVARWATVGLSVLILAPGPASSAEVATGAEVLAAALGHHDPADAWTEGRFRLTLRSERPDGSNRERVLEFDNGRGLFTARWSEYEGDVTAAVGPGDECEVSLDSASEVSAERRQELGLDCDRWRRMRDYYHYMWGLPMKLRDSGTVVGPDVVAGEFGDVPARVVSVTYAPEVGKDVWYFYFALTDDRAVGYRFFHDEAANDGEYIVLEGAVEAGGVRFPRRQSWYMNADDKYLGADELVAAERLD